MKQHRPVPKQKLEKLLEVFWKHNASFMHFYVFIALLILKIFSACVELCKCVSHFGVVVAALGCIHTKSNTATKMQHPIDF